jgi:hypothetical protein
MFLLIGKSQPRTDAQRNYSSPLFESAYLLVRFDHIARFNREGRTISVADAHRGDGQRFVVHADEKLTAFLELESAIRVAGESA